MIKPLVLIFVTLLLLSSCGGNSSAEIEKDIELLQSKSITLPTDIKILVHGKERVMDDLMDSGLKLVVYTDSTGCSSCDINKMFSWNEIIEKTEKYNGRLKFFFLFSPSKRDTKKTEIALKMNYFDYPLFIDSKGDVS